MKTLQIRRAFLLTSALLATLPGGGTSFAQNYPSKPIRIVVPFGPGSGTDSGTRLLANYLTIAVGQPVVVDNKPGGNTVIGAQAVTHAAPDGYTLLMGNNTTHGGSQATVKDIGYEPMRDLVPIAMVGIYSAYLVVHPSIPANTVAELVAYAKANPGKLTYASGSSSSIVMGEAFKSALQLDIMRVPYQSNPPGMTDVIAGRVAMMFPDISSSMAQVKAGTLRPLATITLGERSALAPELPTLNETVMPGFNFVGWIGLFAPAGTPQAIVDRIGNEVGKIVGSAEFRQQMVQRGAEAKVMGPSEFRTFVAGEAVRLPKLLREAGVKPE